MLESWVLVCILLQSSPPFCDPGQVPIRHESVTIQHTAPILTGRDRGWIVNRHDIRLRLENYPAAPEAQPASMSPKVPSSELPQMWSNS